jgi:hypothetical protein
MPSEETLTLALVLTAAGATVSGGLITGLIAMAKNLKGIGTIIDDGNEPTVAFILSAVLVIVAYAATGVFTAATGFAAFLAWYGIAQISMGTHDTAASFLDSGE